MIKSEESRNLCTSWIIVSHAIHQVNIKSMNSNKKRENYLSLKILSKWKIIFLSISLKKLKLIGIHIGISCIKFNKLWCQIEVHYMACTLGIFFVIRSQYVAKIHVAHRKLMLRFDCRSIIINFSICWVFVLTLNGNDENVAKVKSVT